MLIQKLTIISVAALTLTACDQFSGKHEIVRAGNQTFLLNKTTGETKIIDGTSLFSVKPPEASASDAAIKKAKTWPDQTINEFQGVKFKLRTKYRDGALLWKIEAGPFKGELEQTYSAIQIGSLVQPTVMFELYDEEGFKTGDVIELKIRGGSRTVNEKNEVVELNWSGTQPMAPETYQSAAFVSTRWYGFKGQ